MKYFSRSFQSPLPWKGQDLEEYFANVIVANTAAASTGSLNPDGSVASYTQYVGTGMLGETAGWAIFTWFVTWLCVFRGVGMTGRVIYVTMGLPLVLIIILIGRGVSLPNAGEGIKLYFATWRTSALESPQIWQAAFGQIFFSIGVGFGYVQSQISEKKYTDVSLDTSHRGRLTAHRTPTPCKMHLSLASVTLLSKSSPLSQFSVLSAIWALIPPAARSSVPSLLVSSRTPRLLHRCQVLHSSPLFFVSFSVSSFEWTNMLIVLRAVFTLFLLGLTSAFSLLEVMTTLIMDTNWGRKLPRWAVCTIVTIVSALISLIYCTEFGLQALDAVDTYVNDVALFFTGQSPTLEILPKRTKVLDSLVRNLRRNIALPLPRRCTPSRLARVPHLHLRFRRRPGPRHTRRLRFDSRNWCWCWFRLLHRQLFDRDLRCQDTRYPRPPLLRQQ